MRPTWIIILAMITVTSFVNATEINYTNCELSIQQLMDNNACCVKEISGNKIYLNTESIFISEKGIYARINDRAFSLKRFDTSFQKYLA